MDRRSLETFLAVVDFGSMSRAAVHLMVSQPSVSQTIRKLERQLGTRLFERTGGELRISPAGAELIGPARNVVRAFVNAERSVANALDTAGHRLHITMPAILSQFPGAQLLSTFAKANPDVFVAVADQTSVSGVWDDVASGRADLGFVTTLEDPGMKALMLGRHTLMATFPPGTPDPGHPVTMEELASHGFISGPPLGFHSRNVIHRALNREGLTMQRRMQVSHRQMIPRLVLSGAGPSLLIAEEAEELAAFGAVVRATDPVWDRPYYLIHRRERLSPAAEAFVDIAREHADERARFNATR